MARFPCLMIHTGCTYTIFLGEQAKPGRGKENPQVSTAASASSGTLRSTQASAGPINIATAVAQPLLQHESPAGCPPTHASTLPLNPGGRFHPPPPPPPPQKITHGMLRHAHVSAHAAKGSEATTTRSSISRRRKDRRRQARPLASAGESIRGEHHHHPYHHHRFRHTATVPPPTATCLRCW